MYNPKFERLHEEARRHDETNDCSVKAYAVATDTDYATSHYVLAEEAKRPNRGGPAWPRYLAAFRTMGFSLRLAHHDAKTMVTLEREFACKRGRYLVATSSGAHVAAIEHGEVIDWTQGRRHRVTAVWEVIPEDEPEVELPACWSGRTMFRGYGFKG